MVMADMKVQFAEEPNWELVVKKLSSFSAGWSLVLIRWDDKRDEPDIVMALRVLAPSFCSFQLSAT